MRADSQGQIGALAATCGRRREDRGEQAVSNPRPIQRMHLLPGENTRDICREVSLPTLGGVAFCKRWHLGYGCFEDCPRAASHIHPPGVGGRRSGGGVDGGTGGGDCDHSAGLTGRRCHTGPASFFIQRCAHGPQLSDQGKCSQRWLKWEERKGADITGAGGPSTPPPLNVLIYRLIPLIVVHPPRWTHLLAILPGRIKRFLSIFRPISKKNRPFPLLTGKVHCAPPLLPLS